MDLTPMQTIVNKREIRRRIRVADLPHPGIAHGNDHVSVGYRVHHDIPGEPVLIAVASLELALLICNALRERAYARAAKALLDGPRPRADARTLQRRVRRFKAKSTSLN